MKNFLHNNLKFMLTCMAICMFAVSSVAQYCTPAYATGAAEGDYIDRVVLGTIDNTTGDDGGLDYVDYTALSTDLTAGTEYSITVYGAADWPEAIEVWIDYDQDETFESTESIGCAVVPSAGSSDTYTFTVPASALDGTTRMRVMCEYNGPCGLDPCSILYTWGQCEDYSVNISGGGGAIEGCTNLDALNYNPDAEIDDASCIYPYTIISCDYASSIMSSEGSELALGDDEISGAVSIGFDFPFYGTTHSDIYVSSNGYLSFDPTVLSGCCTGIPLPSADYPNAIFFGQEDLDPNAGLDGTISYYTTGVAGSMIFVLSFEDVPHYNIDADPLYLPVTVQVQLYEATGEIRIVTTDYTAEAASLNTMGLNYDAEIAQAVTGRNSTEWSASDECVSFLPYGTEVEACDATVGPGGLYADGITATGATLHWDAVPSASKYVVNIFRLDAIYSKKTGSFTNSLTIPAALIPETTYGFRVKTVCYDAGTISPYGPIYYFTTAPLKEGEFAREIKMYPNPNNGTFNLQLSGYSNSVIDVFIMNAVGQIVYQNNLSVNDFSHVQEISLNGVPSGMYQVKIVDGETISSENLIIE
ncbi:MAG: T9SS type A sorting domain-containing protein [Fimbriimonadaceae bacterium]|nr:T9SS type A sorting domain-containing protein [Chitinophagales bacterium]